MDIDNNTFCGLSRGPAPLEIQQAQAEQPTFAPHIAQQADYPGAIWAGSPNCWQGRAGYPVIAIVNHITQAWKDSVIPWFKSASSEVSAHFLVCQDGTVYQFVRLQDSAWANGIMGRPNVTIPWIATCYQRGINPNLRTISIEHEGMTGQPMPSAQYKATLALQKWLIEQFNIQPTPQFLVGHRDIDMINRPYCPGNSYPWQALLADLATKPKPPAFNPNPDNLMVGPGFIDKLTEMQEQAATNEQWFAAEPNQPGLLKRSFLWTKSGKMLVAFQQPDGGGWEIHAYTEVD